MAQAKRTLRELLAGQVEWRSTGSLRPYPDNPRRHPDDQIEALGRSISKFGWARPIGIDGSGTILFGHGCYEAARRLALAEVPTLTLTGLSEAEKRALMIADNRLAEESDWDPDLLVLHFKELLEIDFDVELTGFSTGQIDILLDGAPKESCAQDPDDVLDSALQGPPVTVLNDCWKLGAHGLICGDARLAVSYQALLGGTRAQMVVTDPPYNVKIEGHARGRSRKKQREFAMASGEMTDAQFTVFLESTMALVIASSEDGSIHYWFMDWRHLPQLLGASGPLYTEWKNLLVWRKSNAGQGSFYRSHHELIAVFKLGNAPHINNFGLGADGRYRTNVLDYPGGMTPDHKRREELEMHPTVKPVALIADLMRDCSRRNGLILDPFGGSGTTLLAAERTGRRARVIEIDPLYVDLSIRRWQRQTGAQAIHVETGRTFDDIAAEREVDHG
ncbi:MAG: DNA methyltransferase [Candidatus Sulfotelmatobacter sp.]